MKKILILLFAIIIAIVATSCYIATERVPLMAYQKQMIPYQKGQKVCFTNDRGDTSLFITTDIITDWYQDETAVVKFLIERYKVNLQSESGEQISLYMKSMEVDYGDDCEIVISIKNSHFNLPFDCTGKFYSRDGQWRVYDSLSINDRIYYDVVEKNGQLYYNKAYGILQLKQDGKEILTLQQ